MKKRALSASATVIVTALYMTEILPLSGTDDGHSYFFRTDVFIPQSLIALFSFSLVEISDTDRKIALGINFNMPIEGNTLREPKPAAYRKLII